MRNLMLAVLVLFVATCAAAGDFAEVQVTNGTPNLDFYLTGKIHGKLGWSAWALASENWSEAFAGPTFAPTTWSEVGFSAGLESGGNRFGESLWLGHGRYSALVLYEHGHTGPWHKIVAKASLGHGFAAGYHDQAFVGRGLHAAYTRKKITFWTALLIKDGHLGSIFSAVVSN